MKMWLAPRTYLYTTATSLLLWMTVLLLLSASTATSGSRIAFIEILFCESTNQAGPSSVYSEKLEGEFASIGSLDDAQGDVLQIHPFGLCNISNSDSFYEDEWVGVVKLTMPSREVRPCNGTVEKALGAVRKGAKAVIFDVTDRPGAASELNTKEALVKQPVITISGVSAKKMMRIVSRQKVLRAKISWQLIATQTRSGTSEYVDMVIFMTCFILITVTCFVLLLKIKWKQTKKESSLAKMAFDAVSKMESKKYAEERSNIETVKTIKEKHLGRKLSIRSSSVAGFSCVICLEEFKNGQEIRVVSCGHEFHLKCVDPWLLTNYTCPLCMLNIVEREGQGIKTESRCSLSFRYIFRCCLNTSASLSSSSMVYSVDRRSDDVETSSNETASLSSNDTAESLNFYTTITTNSCHILWPDSTRINISTVDTGTSTSQALSNENTQHLSCPIINTTTLTLDTSSQGSATDSRLAAPHSSSAHQPGVSGHNMEHRHPEIATDRVLRKYSHMGDPV